MKLGNHCLSVSLLCIVCFSSTATADWKDFWKTPEQRALQAYKDGEYDNLLRNAPDEGWTGLGQFQSENYPAASENFGAHAAELRAAGDIDAANRALYNQGVSDVMAGQFEQAIERFDQVLTEAPELDEARVNRNIAQELLKLQQQPDSGQDGEQSQDGEQGEQGESGDQQQGETQDGEQSESEAGDGEQSADTQSPENDQESAQEDASSGNSEDTENTDESAAQSEAERQQEADDAREALAAEAAQQGDQDQQGDGSEGVDSVTERPMSEEEQATEQLLRRIPDDPAGLLRRKLEQSHRNEYPEVRNAAEPW